MCGVAWRVGGDGATVGRDSDVVALLCDIAGECEGVRSESDGVRVWVIGGGWGRDEVKI